MKPKLGFQIRHCTGNQYNTLEINIRHLDRWRSESVTLHFQSNADTPDQWYGLRIAMEGYDWPSCAALVQRVNRVLAKVVCSDLTALCTALETAGIPQCTWCEIAADFVPLSERAPEGAMRWMDLGSDAADLARCTVHVPAQDETEARRQVLKSLAADYPDRVETWLANGKQVRCIATQGPADQPWRERFLQEVAHAG